MNITDIPLGNLKKGSPENRKPTQNYRFLIFLGTTTASKRKTWQKYLFALELGPAHMDKNNIKCDFYAPISRGREKGVKTPVCNRPANVFFFKKMRYKNYNVFRKEERIRFRLSDAAFAYSEMDRGGPVLILCVYLFPLLLGDTAAAAAAAAAVVSEPPTGLSIHRSAWHISPPDC